MSLAQWTVETLDAEVDAEIEELPPFLRARFFRLLEMIENIGLDRLHEPHVKHIEGKLKHIEASYGKCAPNRPKASPGDYM